MNSIATNIHRFSSLVKKLSGSASNAAVLNKNKSPIPKVNFTVLLFKGC